MMDDMPRKSNSIYQLAATDETTFNDSIS